MTASSASSPYGKDSKDLVITASAPSSTAATALPFHYPEEYIYNQKYRYPIWEKDIYIATAMALLTAAAHPHEDTIAALTSSYCMNKEFEQACVLLFGAENTIYFHDIYFFVMHEYKEPVNAKNNLIFNLIQQVWKPKVIRQLQDKEKDKDLPGNDHIMHFISQLLQKRLIFMTAKGNLCIFGEAYTESIVLGMAYEFLDIQDDPQDADCSLHYLSKKNVRGAECRTAVVGQRLDPFTRENHKILLKIGANVPPELYPDKKLVSELSHMNSYYYYTSNPAILPQTPANKISGFHQLPKLVVTNHILIYLSKQELRHLFLVSKKIRALAVAVLDHDYKYKQELKENKEINKLPAAAKNFYLKLFRNAPTIGTFAFEFRKQCLNLIEKRTSQPNTSSPDSKENPKDAKKSSDTTQVPPHHYQLLSLIVNAQQKDNTTEISKHLALHPDALTIVDDFFMSPLFWSQLFPNESIQMLLAERNAQLLPANHPLNATEYLQAGLHMTASLKHSRITQFSEIIATHVNGILELNLYANMVLFSIAIRQNVPLSKTLNLLIQRDAKTIHAKHPTNLFYTICTQIIPKEGPIGKNSAETILVLLQHGIDRPLFTEKLFRNEGIYILTIAAKCSRAILEELFNMYPEFCQTAFNENQNKFLFAALDSKQIESYGFLLSKAPHWNKESKETPWFIASLASQARFYRLSAPWNTYQQYLAFTREIIQSNQFLLSQKNLKDHTLFLTATSNNNYDLLPLLNDQKNSPEQVREAFTSAIKLPDDHTQCTNDASYISTVTVLLSNPMFRQALDSKILEKMFLYCVRRLDNYNTPSISIRFYNNITILKTAIELIVRDNLFTISDQRLNHLFDQVPKYDANTDRDDVYFILLKHKKINPQHYPKLLKKIVFNSLAKITLLMSQHYQQGDFAPQDLLFAEGLLSNKLLPDFFCKPKIIKHFYNLQTQGFDAKNLPDYVHISELENIRTQRNQLGFFDGPHAAAIDKINALLNPVKERKLKEEEKPELIKKLITEYTELKLKNADEKILAPLRKIILGLRWLPLSKVLTLEKFNNGGAGPTGTAADNIPSLASARPLS